MTGLINLILGVFPKAKLSMRYKMPTFETGEGWMSLASQKTYVSVYTCSPDKIAPYLDRHPETRCGKGCLNFRDSDEIDEKTLGLVVRNALAPDSAYPKR